MLVISRKPGEILHIGRDIKVMVVRVVGQRCVLGIEAPRNIGIRRDELVDDHRQPIVDIVPNELVGEV